jgi:DNA-binding CsgD family transcriptional regulator
MVEQATITERDLRQLLDVIDAGNDVVEGEQFPHEVLRSLQRLIPSFDVTFAVTRPYDGVTVSLDEADDRPMDRGTPAGEAFYWAYWWHSTGSHPLHTGDFTTVFRHSDVRYLYEPRTDGLVCDSLSTHEISVPLPPRGHEHRALTLFREVDDPDFSERELLLLRLLRPHLYDIRCRVERRLAGIPELSARQSEVLRLVAAGYTNAQIARRMAVADSTVRKHLENIYERLGVGTRTAAVAAAFPTADGA